MILGDTSDDSGEITLQMHSQRQEVWNDDDAVQALFAETDHRSFEIGLAKFEKSGLHMRGIAGASQFCGDVTDGLVGRFDAGAVGENDDPRAHTLPWIYARMWCSSSVLRASSKFMRSRMERKAITDEPRVTGR